MAQSAGGRDVLGLAREVTGSVTAQVAGAVTVVPAGEMREMVMLLAELRNEVRLLRLGMIAANDSVCLDLEGELAPTTTSEE